jgi:hypothetical protein
MDFLVWIKFDDDIERRIHVDDVVVVEMPVEPELLGGSVLVEFTRVLLSTLRCHPCRKFLLNYR